jgi:hypothetical protein
VSACGTPTQPVQIRTQLFRSLTIAPLVDLDLVNRSPFIDELIQSELPDDDRDYASFRETRISHASSLGAALDATQIMCLVHSASENVVVSGAGRIDVVLLRQAIQRVKDVLNCLLPDFGFRALSVTSGVSLFIDQMQTISQYGTPFHIAIFLLTCKLVGE